MRRRSKRREDGGRERGTEGVRGLRGAWRGARRLLLFLLVAVVVLLLGILIRLKAPGKESGKAPADPSWGSVDAPESELRQEVARRPQDARARQALGAYLAGTGRPAEALWELLVARELGVGAEETPTLALQIAGALRLVGQPEMALELLREARDAAPGEEALGLALAETFLELARPEEAIAVVVGDPQLRAAPEGLLLLGRARFAAGSQAGARAMLLKGRELGGPFPPPEQQARFDRLLGRIALETGQIHEARARLAAAAAVQTADAEAHYLAGMAWVSGLPESGARATAPDATEAEDRARRYFSTALRLKPRHARAAFELARLLCERPGRWKEAAAAYGKVLALDPRLAEAEEALARVMARLKMPAEEAYHRARFLRLRARPELALDLYRRWGELRPERWESWLRQAECLGEMQRFIEAVRVLESGLRHHPNSAPLYRQLAQLYLLTRAPEDAARLTERWSTVDPASGEPEWFRGRLALKAGRRQEAIHAFEAALKKNPRQPAFHLALAEALAETENPGALQQARSLLEEAERLDPAGAIYSYQLGVLLARQHGREATPPRALAAKEVTPPARGPVTDAARAAFLRALDRDPRRVDAYALVVSPARRLNRSKTAGFLARLARAAGEQSRREQTARRRLWERPDDPDRRRALALTLLRRGDLEGAADHLAAAVDLAAPTERAEPEEQLGRVRRLLATR